MLHAMTFATVALMTLSVFQAIVNTILYRAWRASRKNESYIQERFKRDRSSSRRLVASMLRERAVEHVKKGHAYNAAADLAWADKIETAVEPNEKEAA